LKPAVKLKKKIEVINKSRKSKNRTVLITGATGDLGYEFVRGFSQLNYNILFTSRNKSKSKKLIEFAKKNGCKKIHEIYVDLKDDQASTKIVSFVKKTKLFPDVLVNNARDKNNLLVNQEGEIERDNWINEFKINTIISYELSIKLSSLHKTRLKKIINISSIYGIVAPNLKIYRDPSKESAINYGTIKASLIHLTKELAVRLADKKIQVNSVSFGGIKGKQSKIFQKKYSDLSPQKRMILKNEIFGAINFLISEDSFSVNGQNIVVDGGWTIW